MYVQLAGKTSAVLSLQTLKFVDNRNAEIQFLKGTLFEMHKI